MKRLGFIGVGNMGGAILNGILESNMMCKNEITVFDVNEGMVAKYREKGVNVASDISEVCRNSDMILLCVKPNMAAKVLGEVGEFLDNKALLSIVAGISSENLKKMANAEVRVLRIMPNTPAMVGAGASAFCSETTLTTEERQCAVNIFEAVGIVEWVSEYLFDVVTGLSGGGPAYTAMFIEAMADGAVLRGLPRDTAYRLAAQTVMGTAKMLLETGQHPGAAKDAVCSPGGTTIEGVKALEVGGMRAAVINAIEASAIKSGKLQ